MFKQRCQQKELLDDFALKGEILQQNLDEFETFNQWFGGKAALLNALDKIYKKDSGPISRELTIADLGCGGGDLLVAINRWARARKIGHQLLGIDANPFIIQYAKRKTQNLNNCQYKTANFLDKNFMLKNMDIVCLNSVCHHLTDQELIALLKKLKQNTRMAIVINDLKRNALAYYGIYWLTRLLRFSYLAQTDAPLSVLRAFRKSEWIKVLKEAGLLQFNISRHWIFRWQVIIWCEDSSVMPTKTNRISSSDKIF